MNIELSKEKLPRGRPKKIKIPVLEAVNQEIIEPNQEIKKIPRGRPKQFHLTVHQYNQLYYMKNKEKTKGNCVCDVCNVLISKSNKSRHFASKYHQKMVDFHINEANEVLKEDNENYDEIDSYDKYVEECEAEMIKEL